MDTILAINDTAEVDLVVREVAAQMASVLASRVHTLHIEQAPSTQSGAHAVLNALRSPGASVAVMRVHSAESAACWCVIRECPTPIVLIPPQAHAHSMGINRILLPLDGTIESTNAVATAIALLRGAPIDFVALHVFAGGNVPKHWDQAAHGYDSWAHSFLARHVTAAGASLALRTGTPGEHIVAVADQESVDLIALGWSQRLDPGRAQTVRKTILTATVPVLLTPIPQGGEVLGGPADVADSDAEGADADWVTWSGLSAL